MQVDRLFAQIAFLYVASNGDAHLKNFSVYESEDGDPVLTPAYDLICTSLHLPDESPLALALFADGYFTETFLACGYTTGRDLFELAHRMGVQARGPVACWRRSRHDAGRCATWWSGRSCRLRRRPTGLHATTNGCE